MFSITIRSEQRSRVDLGPTLDRPNSAGPGPVPRGIGLVLSPRILRSYTVRVSPRS